MASGGIAIGILASGGAAFGLFAEGGFAAGLHARGANTYVPTKEFALVRWFFGDWPKTGISSILSMLIILGSTALAAGVIGALAIVAMARDPDEPARPDGVGE